MQLAIKGGSKIRETPFSHQLTYDGSETAAVSNLMRNGGLLSGFRGSWQKEFWGGRNVLTFEDEWQKTMCQPDFLHWAVNSCTSALQIACLSLKLDPGDEVIVTPWSMTCSATAPLIANAVPVFADIERDYFCLDPQSIRDMITDRTRAIIVVDLFGQPFSKEINKIAEEHGLYIIEDAAQSPGSTRDGTYAGYLGDIGCYSFTQGKHLTCGEGGLMTIKDKEIGFNAALIRNHAESVLNAMEDSTPGSSDGRESLWGFNLRMTEIQAVIMREQLKKLFPYIMSRHTRVQLINDALEDIPCIYPTPVRPGCTHAYYVQGFYFDKESCQGIHRDTFIKAVNAELSGEDGRPDRPMLGCGYIKPIYRMPIFRRRYCDMASGDFPVVEKLWADDFFLSMYHNLSLSGPDIKDISDAFHKVWENREDLI